MPVAKRVNVVAVALLAASSFGLLSSGPAQAEMQTAEEGGLIRMPAGDLRAAADARTSAGRVIPRRSPTPRAQLIRLKNLAGDSTKSSADDIAADFGTTAAPRRVFKRCPMQSNTGFAPSDVHGAVGPTNIIEVTNVDISVRDKRNCRLVSAMSLKAFFDSFTIPDEETLFDPRILYDRLSRRCIVTVESRNSGNDDQFLYIASSRDSSCTTWRQIRIMLTRGTQFFCKARKTDFYDYPNAGYNARRLVVTSNNFPTANTSYGTVLSIDKIALHSTTAVRTKCFRIRVPSNITPAIVGDFSPGMFLLSPGSGGGSSIARRRLSTGGAVSSDRLTATPNITIPTWTAPPNARQPNGKTLDSLDGRFQSASKQIGASIWNVHAVNVGGFARSRLYKLSTTGTSVLFSRTGTTRTCRDSDHLFNPSIDTDSNGSIAKAFVTTTRTCPSNATIGRAAMVIFRGRNASNVGWVFNIIATSTSQFADCDFVGPCRWGDYSSTQIDPSSRSTAWGFNQLINGNTQFNWTTQAGRVN